jgi:hypothetical protein
VSERRASSATIGAVLERFDITFGPSPYAKPRYRGYAAERPADADENEK